MARHYFFTTIAGVFLLTASVYGFAWWLQPLSGDLTRIGRYAERDFGWNQAQEQFDQIHFDTGDYKHYYDMVVTGDSFANGGGRQWQNYVAIHTGWTILTQDIHKITIAKLLASPAFQRSPPRVVIMNVVERDVDEFEANTTGCSLQFPPDDGSISKPLQLHPIVAVPHPFNRITPTRWSDINPGFVRAYLWESVLRSTLGVDMTNAISLSLVRSDLFSSRESNKILIYKDDMRKGSWGVEKNARIKCGLAAIARDFFSRGIQKFIVAIAPDKSDVYRPWIRDANRVAPGRISAITKGLSAISVRLDVPLKRAVMSGIKDVYLPNDTHWGYVGHQLVADVMMRALLDGDDAKNTNMRAEANGTQINLSK